MRKSSYFSMTAAGALAGLCASAHAQWVTFVDETNTRLVSATSLGKNDPEEKDLAFGDLDQDGDLDLIVVRKQPFTVGNGKRNVLFMNEGGILVDRTVEFATAATDGGQGFLDITNDRDVAIADFNNDGWLDFVTCPALNQSMPKTISHPRIYMNLGDDANGDWLGFKYEEPRIPLINPAPNGCGIAAGDVTGDGRPDIYLVDYLSNLEDRLLINDGNGFFSDQTLSRMTATMIQSGFGTSGVIADMNNDGVNDIVKSENGPFKATYNNPANQGFFNKHETASSGAHYGMNVGDLNNDGKLDVILGDDGSDRYLLNLGPGADGMTNWESKTYSFQGGGDDGFANNGRVVDLNNDGFNDVLQADVDVDIGGCSRRLHIYRNLGNLPSVTLQEQGTGGIPTSELTGTHDVASFDINGDGWNDLVLGRCAGLRIWMNVPPAGLVASYPSGLPAFLSPGQPTTFTVHLQPFGGGTVTPGSAKLKFSTSSDKETEVPLVPLGNDDYQATLPAFPCTTDVSWYVTATLTPGGTVFKDPTLAPVDTYSAISALGTEITYREEFEGVVTGWTVENLSGQAGGGWEVADPIGTAVAANVAQPEDDATTEGTMCFITQNGLPGGAAGAADVDGNSTNLYSPVLDLEGEDAYLSYAAWFFCDDFGVNGADRLLIEITNNGVNWVEIEKILTTNGNWKAHFIRVSDYVQPTATVQVRFSTQDLPNNSTTEAGVDNFQVETILCTAACPADMTGDGTIDGADITVVLGAWGTTGAPGIPGDADENGVVDGADITAILGGWGACP